MADVAPVVTTFEANSALMLRGLAERLDRSPESIAAEAVAGFVAERTEYLDFLQAGIDDADRGNLFSQDEMEAWFEARHRRAAAE